jgi:hypothetical protein
MTSYEIIITVVALVNLALTLRAIRAGNAKAATSRLDEMEKALRETLSAHEASLTRLVTLADNAVTHDHLAHVYGDLKSISQQVHTLVGQQQQMNDNLRLVLARFVRE